MRVFISWSGERSGHIAKGLKRWLADVLHVLDPWVSFEDIDKGARWNQELSHELENTSVGVICLTPENLTSPWVLFEAGALARGIESSRVCTYLYELRPADVQGPLAAFQATLATKADTLRLIRVLNGSLGERARSESDLDRAFEMWWPELERVLNTVPQQPASVRHHRSDRELLEELLSLARRQEQEPYQRQATSEVVRSLELLLNPAENDATALSEALRRPDERIGLLKPVDDASLLESGRLDGQWTSEWTGGGAGIGVKTGVATLSVSPDYMLGIEAAQENRGPFLLFARRHNDGMFIGGAINSKTLRHSTTWAGWVISGNRIRGQWALGRWDFVRKDGTPR